MRKTAVKITLVAGFLLLLILGVFNSVAQEAAVPLEFGQPITNSITADTPEIHYQFAAQAGDVVIVRMDSAGMDDGLPTPAFRLLSGSSVIVDSTRVFTLALTVGYTVNQLPADGDYTLVATRRDPASGDVGQFTLTVNHAAPMEAGQLVTDGTDDSADKYYVLDPGSRFTLAYVRTGGDFSPSIGISAIQGNGSIDNAADLSGNHLDSGTLTVTPEGGKLYLVRVGRAFLTNSTGEVEYTLMYSAID